MIYLVGSLRNPRIPGIARELREALGAEVFDAWFSPGPETDSYWREHELSHGRTFKEALAGYHAQDVFEFDRKHLERADTVILVLPAGKSGHLELGWALGRGKLGIILLDGEPDRFDVMYAFADYIATDMDDLIREVQCRRSLLVLGTAPVTVRTSWPRRWFASLMGGLRHTASRPR